MSVINIKDLSNSNKNSVSTKIENESVGCGGAGAWGHMSGVREGAGACDWGVPVGVGRAACECGWVGGGGGHECGLI